ncbi:MAG TPA: 2-keto-gluconate dehydrogenase [Gammaproteobacteria bacterium]|nr:2-keto-gluconate dehydrogenase [Gammaproteobacteria bacterium]
MSRQFDVNDDSVVVIIGSGAGGATLAADLCAKGINVVCLEAGKPVQIVQDFHQMFARAVWKDKRSSEGDLNPGLPAYIGKAVGGTALLWGGLALRREPWELKALSAFGPVDGADLADWPLTFDELEPWYEKAEARLNVTGRGGRPFLPDHNHSLVFKAGAAKLGYQQVSNGHMAINTAPFDGRPGCQQMGFCAAGCTVHAKWAPAYAELPKAQASGHFELRDGCMVVRIEHDDQDRVTGVVYRDDAGNEHRQRARAACLAANGIETPRLLLLSESARFKDGLANRSGTVGKHYMIDVLARAATIMPGQVDNYKGATYSALVQDENINDPSRGFFGGIIMAPRGIHLPLFPNELDPEGWGEEFAEVIAHYPNAAAAVALAGDLPVADNRITLHPTETDQHGLPIPHIRKVYHDNDNALLNYGFKRLTEMFQSLGAGRVYTRQGTSALHNLGTCRQSEEPDNGVCNSFGQSHDLENLFISDGSQFVTTGAAPPTLTIVTLAMRQADYIAKQMRTRAI